MAAAGHVSFGRRSLVPTLFPNDSPLRGQSRFLPIFAHFRNPEYSPTSRRFPHLLLLPLLY